MTVILMEAYDAEVRHLTIICRIPPAPYRGLSLVHVYVLKHALRAQGGD